MGFLEVVGAITVFVAGCAATAVVYGCAREAHRAFVQVCRKARIRYGRGWSKKMRGRWRGFGRAWRREMFAQYNYLIIGSHILPHDVRKKIGRRREFYGA